ncbi:23S rRNA G2445 N2-methylase RlmL [Fluviicoccus keumensis]|uniref:Ribosomal RNA large subunit methyltransferase K/L n=1 Tax=Fluviicoccus keumensis TaxID=1435465 RepID=A0A4Q7ZAG6_9GAMM|nr:23S rRNA G2445 N2-methylase RlmL [Fluviicoccus keumensis]
MILTDWVVSCADGLELLLIEELKELGVTDCTRTAGAILVKGTLEQAYLICLWSRLASRVFKPLLTVNDIAPEAMYEAAVAFPWNEVFAVNKTFAIHAVASKGVVTHTQYMALKLKDAIADFFRNSTGQRPDVRVQESDAPLHIFIQEGSLTISLDMSGESLHRRGYRTQIGEAPLKETLAAAILRQAGWPNVRFEALVDPMCGSGTFITEAALMFGDVAPGLHRNYYGFLGWQGHDAELWASLLEEARQREAAAAQKPWPQFFGYDASRDALQAAMKNAHAAGIGHRIVLENRELWKLPAAPAKLGLLVTNPPYGERIGDSETTLWLYKAVGRLARERLPGWQAAVLAADIQHADALGLQHRDTQRLRNGDLTVFVRHGDVIPVDEEIAHVFTPQIGDIPEEGEAFANRVQKNLAHCQKQAQREGVSCYRVYDADLPDYNLAIDVYGDCLHVQEYAAPKEIDPEKASNRFKLALNIIRQVFGLHKEKVFIKVRTQQKGSSQYEKQSDRGKLQDVREGKAHLLVNLTDYLDTGLFLDHRPMRQKIAAEVQGKSFLNLFAYTGSVSVHAALGGAKQTVTVDLSNTYLDWARKNFAVNGISPTNHRFEEADVMEWLHRCRETFDVIFIDPPTFSNSKKMRDVFDVQRDHVELLTLAMRHLKEDGVCYFSNNFRRFELDETALQTYGFEEISPETLGFDFRRNDRIHRCWRLKHTPESVAAILKPDPAGRFNPNNSDNRGYGDRQDAGYTSGRAFGGYHAQNQRGDRDMSNYEDRKPRFQRDDGPRRDGEGRPPRRFAGDRPEGARSPREESGEFRPRNPRPEGGSDRPRFGGGDRPQRPRFEGDRDGNRAPREGGFNQDRPRFGGEGRPQGDRPRSGGEFRRDDRPRFDRGGDSRPPRDGGEGRSFQRDDRPRPYRPEGGADRPRFGGEGRAEGNRPPRTGGGEFRRDDRPRFGGEGRPEGGRPPRAPGEFRRDDRPRFDRGGDSRPPRDGGEGRSFQRDDRPRPYRPEGGSDRPRFGDRDGNRAPREGGFNRDDRPRQGGEGRPYGDRPQRPGGDFRRDDRPRFDRGGDSRPPREGGEGRSFQRDDRPRAPRPEGAGGFDRNRSGGDRPQRPFREGGDNRPPRSGGDFRRDDRPRSGGEFRPRSGGDDRRPARQDGDRPAFRRDGDRPAPRREFSDRPFNRDRKRDDE